MSKNQNLIFEFFFLLQLNNLNLRSDILDILDETETYTNTKELPKEYLILKLRLSFNKDLLENKTINYDIYNKMQKLLLKKMDKIILENER